MDLIELIAELCNILRAHDVSAVPFVLREKKIES
jgi:hypothetical protein